MTLRRIQSVAVSNWRNWHEPAPIEGLEAGVVVLSGPNAVGKTGLWEAIVRGLLDRHWGAHTETLRPAGTKRVIPNVRIAFVAGERRYRIEKHFGGADQRDKASFYRDDGGTWSLLDQGEEAYLRCRAAVLGTDRDAPTRGGLEKAVHDTLMEVLLPPQGGLVGAAPAPDAVSMAVTNRDAATAATRLGRVLDAVRREVSAVWVGQRDRPRKGTELHAGEERLAAIDEAIGPLEEQAERIRACVTKLAAATDELAGMGDATRRHEEAQRLRAEAAEHRARREAAERACADAERRHEAAEALHAARKTLDAAAAEAHDAHERARRAHADAVARREDAERAAKGAHDARDRLAAELERLRAWLAFESREGDLDRMRRLLAGLVERIDRVRANEAAMRCAEDEKAGLALPTSDESAELEALERACVQAQGRLLASAWSVEGDLPPGLRLAVDGRDVAGEDLPTRVTREVTLSGDGGRRIRVTAPADDARSAEEARRALDAALSRFGVENIQALRERVAYVSTSLGGRIAAAKQAVRDALGEESVEDLLRQQVRLEDDVRAKEALVAPAVERPDGGPSDWEALAKVLADRLAAAQARVEESGPALGSARKDGDERLEDVAQTERHAGEARAAAQAHRDAHGSDDAVLRAVVDAERLRDEARAAFLPLDEAKAMAEDAKEKRAGVLDAGLGEVVAKQGEIQGLEALIDELRAQDPERRLAALESERAELAARVARLRVHAEALRLVEHALGEAKEALTAKVGAPIAARIEPWVRYLLQDDSAVSVGEDGVPRVIRTPAGQDIAIDDQSFGTREQVSVLYRLAVADLVAEGIGGGVCLMLDDPFGHTDRARRARLLEILEAEAARRGHQILVFTCRPEDFEGAGRHVPVGG